MKLETKRLELILLTPLQLKLWLSDIKKLEGQLGCSYQGEPLTGFFYNIVKKQLEIVENDPQNYFWHSFWWLIYKEDRAVVGAVDFKNIPNTVGEVEIGYGLGKMHEHRGFMTEAVKEICHWALQQTFVTSVIAETSVDGIASQRILQRCGFKKERQEDTLWWRR